MSYRWIIGRDYEEVGALEQYGNNVCVCVCVCVYVYFYIYIHTLIFFIHSFIDGHVGSFHTLAIVNNAAINTRMQISL